MASVKRHQKLPPCWAESIPAGSEKDALLAKVESLSNIGSISVIIYLRWGKKCLYKNSWERGVRICERSSPRDTKVREEGAGGGAEIPLQCGLRPW